MASSYSDLIILSGNANRALAKSIADHLSLPLCDAVITAFADGEISVRIEESIRGKDIFLVQYGIRVGDTLDETRSVNDNLMELLVLIDTLKRASAGRINVVTPYYAYCRQDRKASPRVPISAKLVADLISVAGADRVLTIDLHSDQIMGFFDIPVDRLHAMPIMASYIMNHDFDLSRLVVVAPDMGSVTRSRKLAERIGVPIAIIDKRHVQGVDNVTEVMSIIGDVNGKDVIMIDDIIDTAGTVVNSAYKLKESGAEKIYAACTHALLSGPAVDRIRESPIDKLVITDTVPLPQSRALDKIEVVSVAELLSKAIYRIHSGAAVSVLFE
ncbi:MAG: ribose-phosphate pyrophosphokinase [Eubacteriaceae bacterium]|nr:ribose-phosphate pyrophosphokinase [Eubacteriaceae bacterium]